MQKKLLPGAAQYAKQNHLRHTWQKIVSVMACIVVFSTTYALILPAITLENECALGEHTHTESCYVQVTSEQVRALMCDFETLGVHVYTQDCRNLENVLECGYHISVPDFLYRSVPAVVPDIC